MLALAVVIVLVGVLVALYSAFAGLLSYWAWASSTSSGVPNGARWRPAAEVHSGCSSGGLPARASQTGAARALIPPSGQLGFDRFFGRQLFIHCGRAAPFR